MTTEATAILTEELEAALLEGAAPASPEAFELVERYRELTKAMAPLKAEQEAIKELVMAELLSKHVTKLTHDGVVAVELIHTHRVVSDLAGLRADEPEIAAKYISTKEGTRFDFKK